MIPDDEINLVSIAATAKRISDLGVPTSIGAHGQREGLGAHWDIWSFVLGGMTPHQALETATINPAMAYGLDRDLGSIEPGKLADLVVLDGNPLENIRNSSSVHYTVANGVVYDSNMDQVAGGTRKRAPFWFEQSAGGGATPARECAIPSRGWCDLGRENSLATTSWVSRLAARLCGAGICAPGFTGRGRGFTTEHCGVAGRVPATSVCVRGVAVAVRRLASRVRATAGRARAFSVAREFSPPKSQKWRDG